MEVDENTLLNDFEYLAKEHAKAGAAGNYKLVNKNYDKIVTIVEFLYTHGELNKLNKFLENPCTEVRLAAATYLLPIDESTSLKILKDISKDSGFVAFEAKMVIEEWNNGGLKPFPWPR